MDPWIFLFVLLKSLIQYPQPVGDDLDVEQRMRMEERAKYLEWERMRLEQEMEQQAVEQVQLLQLLTVAVLVILLMVLWFIGWKNSLRRERGEEEHNAGNEEEVRNVLADGEEEGVGNEEDNANWQEDNNDDGPGEDVGDAAANEEDNVENEDYNANWEDVNNDDAPGQDVGNVAANEEDNVENEDQNANWEDVNNDDGPGQDVGNMAANEEDNVGNEDQNANWEDVNNDDAPGQDVGNVAANEEDNVGNEDQNANWEDVNNDDAPGQDVGNVAVNEEDNVGNEDHDANREDVNNDGGNVGREAEADLDNDVGRVIMQHIQWPVQDLQAGCEWITSLMDNYTIYFGHILSNSFYPELQRAIGVGSAFEGWSPREEDVVFQVLIPMAPPRGHSFHLELESAEQRQVRNFRVRVQLECTCTGEQQGEDMMCFLHQPEEELKSNQDPSLLDTLCTGSYLDVQKTARWFYQLVRAIWPALPQSHNWQLVLLPSKRSCQFKVTNGTQSFRIEMLFGVRRGDSHIFVSSQPREAYTQSTTWPETYAVAETEFFKYIARQAPPDSLHLKCLQFFTHLPVGLCFSTYAMKTIVMHLLNAIAVSQWRRRHLRDRLEDIIDSLRLCVHAKRVNHFIVGNLRLPRHIQVPADVQTAATPNLFHHLTQQSDDDNIQVLDEYMLLRERYDKIIQGEN